MNDKTGTFMIVNVRHIKRNQTSIKFQTSHWVAINCATTVKGTKALNAEEQHDNAD